MKINFFFAFLILAVLLPFRFPSPVFSEPEITEDLDFYLYDNRGNPLRLSEFGEGKPVLILFWALWSEDATETLRTLQERLETYRNLGIKVLSVNVDRNPMLLSNFIADEGISFPVLKDPQGIFEDLYEIYVLPTNILIDKDNVVLYRDHQLPEPSRVETLVLKIEV